MALIRPRSMILSGLILFAFLILTFSSRGHISLPAGNLIVDLTSPSPENTKPKAEGSPKPTLPVYKPERVYDTPPIVDNFPLAGIAHSAAGLPSIPPWNQPPNPHVAEKTPLFIGFTRNWLILQQAVVAYITAGWPPEDIYVVENTGTMNSNAKHLLTLQNPFFLNTTRLQMLGVNILSTPTLFSFAQMQNFFLYTAIEKDYPSYFWSHMDVVALPYEDRYNTTNTGAYKSLYGLAVDVLRAASTSASKKWAIKFFSYDRLALVNRSAFEQVGGWDPAIPYYFADCDMHDRLKMHGYDIGGMDSEAGYVYDVADSMDDLVYLYRKVGYEPSFTFKGQAEEEAEMAKKEAQEVLEALEKKAKEEAAKLTKGVSTRALAARTATVNTRYTSDTTNSTTFANLLAVVQKMEKHKNHFGGGGRNYWQSWQKGGKGEPYYKHPEGFERGVQMMMDVGRGVYAEKWGHRDCGLVEVGRKLGDEWRVEKDWE